MAFDVAPENKYNSARRNADAFGPVYAKITQPEKFENTEDTEEVEESLDSETGIDNIMIAAENLVLDRLVSSSEEAAEFGYTDAFDKLNDLEDKLSSIRAKLEAGEEITNEDGEAVQAAYNAVETSIQAETEYDSEVEQQFDPGTYAQEQFDEHGFITATNRSRVYSLVREYQRALKETDEGKDVAAVAHVEQIAQEIKSVVDELVGNDVLPQEGVGYDLSPSSKKETGLRIKNLDLDEGESISIGLEPVVLKEPETIIEKLQSTATPGIDFSVSSRYSEEIAKDIQETQQDTENLRVIAQEQEQEDMDDEPDVASVSENVYSPEQKESDDNTYGEPIDMEAFAGSDARDELFEDEDDYEEELVVPDAVPTTTSFTPESVAAKATEIQSQPKEASEKINQEAVIQAGVKKIENTKSWWDSIISNDVSPYEVFQDLSFKEVMDWQDSPQQLEWKLMSYRIDRDDYNKWAALEEDIMTTVEVDPKQTFKEVVDQYIITTYTK